ncbi:K+-transporting ATPase ATPase C chain [Amycolatopsis mediterranei S699]|uniref:Potassium-transporting ATPase KdpC subunit n=2 Tax=Amycolatopsis mediterranei TaxID=33910 RepID=A0A0H3D0J3_AMYMU|nr:potassium-transporting ATPase subunit C [Amycolatopsis mediterranei]ADJ43704.1 K+-transporting ATPase ATPase C chain [Amycolatopsis mediterranei U32]AEK40413.1 K+-transporting ATPase ATPase C chain [Amycolatopsis mediterranei S699]AFO75416.1 K+-transporting ATPase ATPase C chain [Amycolatopsis mediterranei S699]AGT82545.1 K+-transporting ATPase ATPase C chain [Amycolatopsis mediterranei RB]KDO10203.1 potassium ABC transporter ATPase [Amycolatopsis mediterranei]
MNTLVKQTWAGLRVLLVLTVLLGILYPLAVWAVTRIPGLEGHAEGSIVTQNGQAVGSSLIGVDPVPADPAHDPWFHTRPSAIGPGVPSGASNKGPDNADLVQAIEQRKASIAEREGVSPGQVPPDAVTASGSGLDPAISVAYADLQAARVARNTGLSLDRVKQLIAQNTSGAGIGVPGVTVLPLNLAVRAAAGGAH